MKLRYIFATLVAALSVFTGCVSESDHFLDEVQVSSSYLAFTAAGNSVEVAVTATADWSVKDLPDWISASPMSGGQGANKVIFTASAADETREGQFSIVCSGKSQTMKAIQVTAAVEVPVTPIAKAIEAGAGNFRVRGTVTKVTSDQYGNFYMSDDTGEIYIYGTKDAQGYPKDGSGGWARFGIDPGDIVTVQGPISLYGSTWELVDVEVIDVEKSLIDVADFDFTMLPATDTTFDMTVNAKVSPLLVTSDASWLQVVDVKSGNVFVLHADANDYTAVRTANLTIKAPGALKSVSVSQEGIPATGQTVSEIIGDVDDSLVETLESTVIARTGAGFVLYDGAKALYVYSKDKASEVSVGDNVKVFGKKTTYNGVPEITDVTDLVIYSHDNTFEVPSSKDITSEAGSYSASEAEYVKLTGTLAVSGNYYNIALDGLDDKMGSIVSPVDELDAKSFDGKKITVTGWFNGLSGGGKYINVIATKIVEFSDNPKGSAGNPYTASEIAAEILAGNVPEENVYIKGIVSAVLYDASANYPTATFWISDDGTAYGVADDKKSSSEPSKDFECYGVYWFGGEPWAEGNGQVTVGDEVVVCGKTTAYKGQPETSNKSAWLHSVNYVTTAGNGLGSTAYPFNIAGIEEVIDFQQAAIDAAKEAEAETPVFNDVCVKGKVSAILYTFSASYGTGTFWISDDGTAYGVADDKKSTTAVDKDFECYSVYWLGGQPWAEGNAQPEVGDDVIVRGQFTIYKGTYETSGKKAYVYSHNGAIE